MQVAREVRTLGRIDDFVKDGDGLRSCSIAGTIDL